MSLELFNGADSSRILKAIHRGCSPSGVLSVQFRSAAPVAHSLSPEDQWLRIKGILACRPVYEALNWKPLSIDVPARFHHAQGLETIGALANLLLRGGVHQKFVESYDSALNESRTFLDAASVRCYDHVEAYTSSEAWCDWFLGEGILDETVLLGVKGDWWLLAVTDTD